MEKKYYYLRCLVLFAVLAGFVPCFNAAHGDDFRGDPRQVMEAYFGALKGGDVQTLITLLTDPMLDSRRMLLEKNSAYPAYLRDYYKDAAMLIMEIRPADDMNRQFVVARISFEGDDHPLLLQFLLKYTNEGWKIAEESPAP